MGRASVGAPPLTRPRTPVGGALLEMFARVRNEHAETRLRRTGQHVGGRAVKVLGQRCRDGVVRTSVSVALRVGIECLRMDVGALLRFRLVVLDLDAMLSGPRIVADTRIEANSAATEPAATAPQAPRASTRRAHEPSGV